MLMKAMSRLTSLIYVFHICICLSSSSGICGAVGASAALEENLPAEICPPPVQLYDISNPTAVIGDGTPASCTQAALQTAANGGGTIVFDCGPSPATIALASPITIQKETVLDGAGLITLDGNKLTRILYLDSAYNLTTPRLVVQRLTFQNGKSARSGDDTADGGGAIYRDGGSLTAINCMFLDNQAPSPGQDIAGGAIYGFGGGDTILSGCVFTDNSASNGGAVGSLNSDLIIVNSNFTGNAAAGSGGNPGQGGCGGAVYMDGGDERTEICGVRIVDSTAGAIGGGFFRVSNDSSGTFTMDRSTVDANQVTATSSGNAGGLYLQGLQMTVTNSTISRNRAWYNGGIWIHTCQVQMTNVTIAENVATGSNGGGLWLSNQPAGMLLNCTIANNHADGQYPGDWNAGAGAVFGGHTGLVLKNSLVSGNTGTWGPSCDNPLGSGGGNIQWTGAAPCASDITVADPLLGSLGENGGPTETMLPAASSPARMAGSDCPGTDQRGRPRGEPCTSGAVQHDVLNPPKNIRIR
jgi:hypothetical protein